MGSPGGQPVEHEAGSAFEADVAWASTLVPPSLRIGVTGWTTRVKQHKNSQCKISSATLKT
jgi:hypothetical protein